MRTSIPGDLRSKFVQLAGIQVTLAALIVGGLLLRLTWLWLHRHNQFEMGEALRVAHAIQEHRGFADSFQTGQGPTAHLTPLAPGIAGIAFLLFGYQTALANVVLSLWALFLVFGGYWLQFRSFELLGAPRWALLAAMIFLCLMPLNMALEVASFRVWEGALAVALGSSLLYLLVRWDGSLPTWRRIAATSGVMALLLFVTPTMGIAGATAFALYLFRNLQKRRWLGAGALAAGMIMLVLLPWAVRNEIVFGHPILLRSDAGLELAVGFRPYAMTHSAEDNFKQAMETIHPRVSAAAFSAMRRMGGEAPYSDWLGSEATRWMMGHPGAAFRLATDHVAGMFFPPRWYWRAWSEQGALTGMKVGLNWILSALGLMGMALACASTERRFLYPVIMVGVTALSYAAVQPILRYRYLIFGLLVYFAALFVAWLFATLRSKWPRLLTQRLPKT